MFLSSIILVTASIKFLGCQVIIGIENVNLTAVFQPNYNKCVSAPRRENTGYYSYCSNTTFSQLSQVPLKTTRLDFILNNIAVLEGGPFSNFSQLNYLNLTKNEIEIIKSSAFRGLRDLTDLVLSDNLIETIEEDAFEYCPLISFIDLSGNRMRRLESFALALSPLGDLEDVSFRRNHRLDAIDARELRALEKSSLFALDLGFCNLKNIGEGAFSHLKQLSHLVLTRNPLKEDQLASGLINVSREINILDLTAMGVSEIPTDVLNHLSATKLRFLHLENNPIQKIEIGDFPHLPSLVYLNLRNCTLRILKGEVFKNLTNLRTLDLREHQLRSVEPAISNLVSLKRLDLSENRVYEFDLGVNRFINLTNLEVLSLNNLGIAELKRLALNGLKNLRELFLISETLVVITEKAFESLQNLEKLVISGYSIEQISEDTFFGLGNLTELVVEKNKITIDPAKKYFTHTPSLEILDLSENQIAHLPHRDLENLHQLRILEINGNQILPWTEPLLSKNGTNLKFINLRKSNLNHVTSSMLIDFDTVESVDISENPYNCSLCETYAFGLWINKTKIKLSSRNAILCDSPKNISQLIIDITELPSHCVFDSSSQITTLIIINCVFAFCVLLIAIAVYYYRWYLRYYWYVTRAKVYRLKAADTVDFRYDAFVSYNAEDGRWLAENLLPRLEDDEPRLNLCIPERDFPAGGEIVVCTVEAMKNSHKVVLIVSNNFLQSAWCIWEMKMAQFQLVDDRREALVIIILEDLDKTRITSTLKRLLKTRTYLRWSENVGEQERFWERLRITLHNPQRREEIAHRNPA